MTIGFDAYPRVIIDHLVSDFDIAPGDLVVDAGCQLALGLSAAGALVVAFDTFALPDDVVAALVHADAPVHFTRGRSAALPEILARELGPTMHPRVVAFGSSFRFMDQRAALDACDRCDAEGVAVVFGRSAPSPWRAIVADIIVDAARSRVAARAGVKNEAMPAVFAGSAFSHLATCRRRFTSREPPTTSRRSRPSIRCARASSSTRRRATTWRTRSRRASTKKKRRRSARTSHTPSSADGARMRIA